MNAEKQQAQLLMHGSIVMVLGMFAAIGLSVAATLNLDTYGSWKFAHLEGMMNGLMLLAVGAGWNCIQQSKAVSIGRWLLVIGGYANIIGPLIAALFVGHRRAVARCQTA